MKRIDINKRFTEIVNEYIQNGYYINTTTMGGSQGEDAKVDLTDGEEIIRVLLDRFNCGFDEGMCIQVGRANAEAEPNSERHDTIWSNELEVIREERFYLVGSSRGGAKWYGTKEEQEAAKQLHYERWKHEDRGCAVSLPDAAKAVALRWVKKQPRRKSVKLSAIGEVYVSYTREWNGKMVKRYCVEVGNDTLRIR